MFSFLKSFISKKRKQREMGRKGLIGSRKRRTEERTIINVANESRFFSFAILTVICWLCITVLVLPGADSQIPRLILGQSAPESIFADFKFTYEDLQATEKKREEAKNKVPLYYNITPEKDNEFLKRAEEIFNEIPKRLAMERRGQVYKGPGTTGKLVESLKTGILPELNQIILNSEKKKQFLELIKAALAKGIISSKDREGKTYGQKIRITDTKGRIRKAKHILEVETPPEAAQAVADEMLKYYSQKKREELHKALMETALAVLGNAGDLVFDEKLTLEKRKETAAKVPPVMIEVRKGRPVITKNEIVDRKALKAIQTYFKKREEISAGANFWQKFVRSTVICVMMMFITSLYLSHIHPDIVKSNHNILLIGSVVGACVLLNYGTVQLFNILSRTWDIQPFLNAEILPLGLTSILLSTLMGLRVAVYAGLFVAVIASLMLGGSFDTIVEGLLVSCTAGYAVRRSANYRSFFLRGGLTVFLTVLLLDYSYLWEIKQSPNIILWTVALSLLNAVITAIFSLVLLFFFEMFFNVSTNMSLLMLCDYNHPLLKRLQFEAPGTYHHSLMVSTLAEHAAIEVGANPIKVRVCALFHDIGKLTKPEYFTENNIAVENKHRELHPRMSSLIILNHVKDGIDLAIKYKLKKIIRNAIQQHHGTDIVYYFFKRALEENREKDVPVEEQEYRYPGPLPREKEVVVLSLADACEAASRSLQKPSHAKVDALVWEILRKRIRDGQLDEADLTFGELAKIRKSFVKTLTTMLHGRIAYPKEDVLTDEDDLFMASKKVSGAEAAKAEKTPEKDA